MKHRHRPNKKSWEIDAKQKNNTDERKCQIRDAKKLKGILMTRNQQEESKGENGNRKTSGDKICQK